MCTSFISIRVAVNYIGSDCFGLDAILFLIYNFTGFSSDDKISEEIYAFAQTEDNCPRGKVQPRGKLKYALKVLH